MARARARRATRSASGRSPEGAAGVRAVVSAPGCGARVLVGLLATKRRGPARTNQYTITRPWGKGEAFGRIPNWIFVRPELSRQARYLYCDLVRRKSVC